MQPKFATFEWAMAVTGLSALVPKEAEARIIEHDDAVPVLLDAEDTNPDDDEGKDDDDGLD